MKLDGKPVLRADKAPQAYVDFFRPAGVYPVGTTHPEGALDPGPVQIEKVELEESGSLRTVVRLEGRAMAQEPARVILRLEAYAGKPFVRLYYTTEFMQRDPRQVFVRRMGLRLPLAAQGGIIATVAGGQGGPVALQPAAVTGLQQTSHLNYELWQAERDHPWREVRESGFRSRGWLSAGDTQAGMAVVVRDMWQEFPKELVFRQEDGAFEIGLWPENAPLMDVRRYSNYGHIGQGESAGEDPSWVVDRYYAKDFARGPFVGVSKTDELLLLFHRGASPSQLDAVAADFQSRPLVYAGWDTYARTGITMPMNSPDDPKFARLNANLINAADWWLFHQRCYGWYGMWNYGDVQHMFHGGYGQIYTSDALAKILQLPAAKRTPENLSGYAAKADYFCQNDWAYDNGRWGWGNTEGLPNHFMSLSYLRTGRRDLFFFMEANARHSRDVVARHAGGWLGAGTRHGVQPWSDGNHEERQTVFSEQRFHYLLTGEHRTREWIRALAEKVYLVSPSNNYAAHCARSYNLLFFWEITGDPDVGATLQQYMHCLAQPEGIVVNANVRFPQGTLIDKSGVPHVANWMFTNFGAMHAMLEYYYLTQDAQVRDAFLHEAEFILKTENPPLDKSYGMMSKVMAFAARHAPDGTPYRNAIREWMTGFGLRRAFQAVTTNRAHWAGETAFFGSGLVSAQLFWLNDAMYVAGALPEEPALTPKDLAAFKQAEDRPVIARPRAPRDSWQSEYDRPEFKEYFKEHLRPETGK